MPHVVWPDMFELQQQLADKTAAHEAALVVYQPVAHFISYIVERVYERVQGDEANHGEEKCGYYFSR